MEYASWIKLMWMIHTFVSSYLFFYVYSMEALYKARVMYYTSVGHVLACVCRAGLTRRPRGRQVQVT